MVKKKTKIKKDFAQNYLEYGRQVLSPKLNLIIPRDCKFIPLAKGERPKSINEYIKEMENEKN